jgi:AcrR family transcriptional regulator
MRKELMKKMRGRPSGISEEKRKKILEISCDLFKRFGSKKVSVDEICRQVGMSRVTFYRYFDDKVAVIIFILKEESQRSAVQVRKILASPESFLKKFESIRQLNLEMEERLGTVFLADLMNHDKDSKILKCFTEMSVERKVQTELFLKLGKKERFLDPHLPMPLLLTMMRMVNAFYFDAEFTELYPNPIERADVMNQFFFYGAKGARLASSSNSS